MVSWDVIRGYLPHVFQFTEVFFTAIHDRPTPPVARFPGSSAPALVHHGAVIEPVPAQDDVGGWNGVGNRSRSIEEQVSRFWFHRE